MKPRSSVVRSRGMSPEPRGWPPSGSAMERLRFSWSAALKLLQKVAMTPQHSSSWKLAGSSQKKAARSFRACSRVRRPRRRRSSSRWASSSSARVRARKASSREGRPAALDASACSRARRSASAETSARTWSADTRLAASSEGSTESKPSWPPPRTCARSASCAT